MFLMFSGWPVIPTFQTPLCVTATFPVIVLEPVVGTGTGLTMRTASPSAGPWAAACREFMRTPTAPSATNRAATITWFFIYGSSPFLFRCGSPADAVRRETAVPDSDRLQGQRMLPPPQND